MIRRPTIDNGAKLAQARRSALSTEPLLEMKLIQQGKFWSAVEREAARVKFLKLEK